MGVFKFRKFSLVILCVVLCCCINFTTSVSASEEETWKTYDVFDAENRTDPEGRTLSGIAKNTYSEKDVEQLYQSMGEIYIPGSYWVDPTIYIVEYTASQYFLTSLKDLNTQGIVSEMFAPHPTLYIPIFAEIENQERVVGHVKIYFNVSEEKYVARPAFNNVSSEEFATGEFVHFIERIYKIHEFLTADQKDKFSPNSSFILVRFSNAINDYTEKVLLINSNNSYMVYDFTNTAHMEEESKEEVLEAEEYAELRLNYEASAKGGSLSPESIPASGYVSPGNPTNSAWIYWLIVVFLVLLAVIFFLLSRKRNHK